MSQKPPEPVDWDAFLSDLHAEQESLPEGHRAGFVAVVGQPNVGKSTLMNRLVGQKVAIVSPKPQTTRRRIRGIMTRDDAQVVFVDTPGIHDPFHRLGEYMVESAIGAIPDADVVLFIVDAATLPDELDREIAARVAAHPGTRLLLLNKIDLVEQEQADRAIEAYDALGDWDALLPISATEGLGVEALLDRIVEGLPEGPRYYPTEQVTDQSERELAAEIIREQALEALEQEVPHSLNVEVTDWTEREHGKTYVEATIFVERESQKGIVIGAKGAMLKRISSRARREIERALGQEIYLEIWVKVRDKWRSSDTWLDRWGFKPPKG